MSWTFGLIPQSTSVSRQNLSELRRQLFLPVAACKLSGRL